MIPITFMIKNFLRITTDGAASTELSLLSLCRVTDEDEVKSYYSTPQMTYPPEQEISYEGLYNGNIAGIENVYVGDNYTNKYTFTYDGMNRLTQAYTTNNNAYMEVVGYDLNGNIHELLRAGKHNDGTYKMTDALIYSYNGNQIHSIQDAGGALVYDGSFDFKPSGSTEAYQFNANGAMTYDPNKGITIDYLDWGSPSSITFDSGNTTQYVYAADGTKLKVSWNSGTANCKPYHGPFIDDDDESGGGSGGNSGSSGGNSGSQGGTTTNNINNSVEYVGPFIIIEDSLSRILFDGGYCTINGNLAEYHYYVKDHLGSNRLVVDENGNVEQKTYYYPFGGVYGDISTNTDVQSYKYNGKELDHQHGLDLYDYGARMYDPAVGSWTSLDPLCEKYYNVSPYAYCHNNPVNLIDLYGMKPDSISAALMSALAYGYNYETYSELISHNWFFVSHHESESGFKYNIYRKRKSDGSFEYTYAYAGTDTEDGLIELAKDVINDIGNYLGYITPQYLEAAITALGISNQDELTFVGHSLGGGLAALSSKLTGRDAITFNPASLSGNVNVIASAVSLFRGGHITQYRAVGNGIFGGLFGDPVNTFQGFTGRKSQGKVIPVYVGKNCSHGIKDIIDAFYRNAKHR